MDACSLNEPCSLIGSPSALSRSLLRPVPPGRPAAVRSSCLPSPVPRQVGGTDDACLRAELAKPDVRHLPVRARSDPLVKRTFGRLAYQFPGGRDPATEDEHARVEDGGESRHALPEPGADHT